MKIVVVSPHRDDAAFSVGLAIDAWLAARQAVDVLCCFTRSSSAPFSDADSLHPNDRLSYVTAVRAREDLAWSKMYRGALSLTDLRLKDAPIRFRCPEDEVLGRSVAPADKAIGVIQKGLSRSGGNAFVLPHWRWERTSITSRRGTPRCQRRRGSNHALFMKIYPTPRA